MAIINATFMNLFSLTLSLLLSWLMIYMICIAIINSTFMNLFSLTLSSLISWLMTHISLQCIYIFSHDFTGYFHG